jgi:hypothetical protein
VHSGRKWRRRYAQHAPSSPLPGSRTVVKLSMQRTILQIPSVPLCFFGDRCVISMFVMLIILRYPRQKMSGFGRIK